MRSCNKFVGLFMFYKKTLLLLTIESFSVWRVFFVWISIFMPFFSGGWIQDRLFVMNVPENGVFSTTSLGFRHDGLLHLSK